jgi:hypothetical protein
MRNDWIGNGTRNVLERAAAAVMIFILLWKIFQFLVFLPLSGAAHFGDYLPFALEFILAFISLVLSFTKHRIASFAVASVLALVAVAYWWSVICRSTKPIWSDFEWLTIPDFIFAAAAYLRWFSQSTSRTHLHQRPMETENV